MGSRITTWLNDLNGLADEMAAAGQTKLRDDLHRAYAEVERFDASVPREEASPEAPVWSSMPERQFREHPTYDGSRPEAVEPDPEDTDFDEAPEEFKKKLKELAKRMSSLDNALSLVIATKTGDFIDFGDLEDDALQALLLTETVKPSYHVMLAPHHGTHEAPSGLPKAVVCISQNGVDHHRKNFLHRRTHSNDGCCISTWDRGNIDVEAGWWGFGHRPWR